MHEFRIGLPNTDQLDIQIGKWFVHIQPPPDYATPDGQILIDRRKLARDFVPKSGTVISKGTPVLEIHFNPDIKGVTPSFSELQYVLPTAGQSYLRFLSDLKTSRLLRDIDLIVGVTYPRTAKFAVKRLGFHYAASIPGMNVHMINLPNQNIPVYAFSDELIAQKGRIRKKLREI